MSRERQVVELLQDEVARIVEDVRARMVVHGGEEALERDAVVQVLARVDLEAAVHALFFERVQDRPPAAGEFREAGLDQPDRALRPRVHHRPEQGAGEGGVGAEAQVPAGRRGELHLLDGPFGTRCGPPAQGFGSEPVEQRVVGGVDRHELALEVGRKFRDLDAVRPDAPA